MDRILYDVVYCLDIPVVSFNAKTKCEVERELNQADLRSYMKFTGCCNVLISRLSSQGR